MRNILLEKLQEFIQENNPDLVVKLEADFSATRFLNDRLDGITAFMEGLLAEGRPSYIIEELCMQELTAGLRPSRYHYLKSVLEEEFPREYQALEEAGVIKYEVINMLEACKGHFEAFEFSEENEQNRYLRYSVIAEIHDYLN